eukprot:5327-Heterococcus_DN1.PRE.1
MDNYHPLNTTVDEGLAVARRVGATCVVGIGSGGVIDNAKAIAALFGSSGVCIPHLECPSDAVLGIQNAARQRSRGVPLPCVAIPSSAGCGAACSTQTLVLNLEEGLLVPLKQSDAYEQQDTTVLIDPSLTTTLDANLTIAMALTALSNCIDALLTTAHKADAATVAIHKEAIRGIGYIGKSLPHALSDGSNIQARHDLCEASMIGGLLSGNRHDIAPPLQTLTIAASSGLIYTPYPQVAAVLLPYYIEYLHEQDSEQYSKVLASISTALGTSDVMQWLHPLIKQLSIQHLNDCNERLNAKSMASNAELLAISLSSDTSSSGSSSVPDLLTKDIAASVYEAAM